MRQTAQKNPGKHLHFTHNYVEHQYLITDAEQLDELVIDLDKMTTSQHTGPEEMDMVKAPLRLPIFLSFRRCTLFGTA